MNLLMLPRPTTRCRPSYTESSIKIVSFLLMADSCVIRLLRDTYDYTYSACRCHPVPHSVGSDTGCDVFDRSEMDAPVALPVPRRSDYLLFAQRFDLRGGVARLPQHLIAVLACLRCRPLDSEFEIRELHGKRDTRRPILVEHHAAGAKLLVRERL